MRSFDGKDAQLLRKTAAYHLLFVDRTHYALKNENSPLHLVVGAISMVNHCKYPNCTLQWNIDPSECETCATLIAQKPIKLGEELFIEYHNIDEYEFD